MDNIKLPMEAVMLCTIDGDIFYLFTKNTWHGDSKVSCHITYNDTHLFNDIDIDKSIQESFGNMPAIKKRKLCIIMQQVDRTEHVHNLWPMKFCPKVDANLFSLTCKLLQRSRIKAIIKTTLWSNSSMTISY